MKKNKKRKTNIIIVLVMGLIFFIIYNLYIMYRNIDIKDSNYNTQKLAASIDYVENKDKEEDNFFTYCCYGRRIASE